MNPVCENCGFETPGKRCAACGDNAPAWAKFCPNCGANLERGAAAPQAGGSDPLTMENRRACSDGNCIGILGADGRCIVCGKAA
jgi:predicted amidophosphoribosyltransferase